MAAILLPVPYESQGDNESGSGWRECFSSSAAMVAGYWGRIASDDAYNRIRERYGDTTSVRAQVATLSSLGLFPTFTNTGTRSMVEAQIRARRPVLVLWLHRGPVTRPSGGGHASVVVGLEDESRLILHDPNGEPLMIPGGHDAGRSGRAVRVTWRNFLARWAVEGPGTGWAITCSPTSPQAARGAVADSQG